LNPALRTFLDRHAATVAALLARELRDPCALLGWQEFAGIHVFLTLLPCATRGWVGDRALARIGRGPLYGWAGPAPPPDRHRLRWLDGAGRRHEGPDPWSPPGAPRLGSGAGAASTHYGACPDAIGGVAGVRYRLWAPRARAVAVVLDGGRQLPMCPMADAWDLFVPGETIGCGYLFEIVSAHGHALKTDPHARELEPRPGWRARVTSGGTYAWTDHDWMAARSRALPGRPTSIYELHAGSYARCEGLPLRWTELAERLVADVVPLGFTDVELLPVMAHPHAGSWGYQASGFFAPDPRHGSPDELRAFVDRLHRAGLGVILDWVPGHFATDPEALVRFDGEPLYEPSDPRRAEHRAWGTLAFDYERPEVREFLLASARHWLREFHVDGLRVDAVASMVYLDFQRAPGEWLPAADGGAENRAAISFLQALTELVHREFPGARLYAEDSSIRPGTTAPVAAGGLGFDFKWSLGWMHDTLGYFATDPLFRRHRHDALLEATGYADSERHVLPLSHDEVVHGKRSLLGRMPGDTWQRHANLRLMYAWQWTHPGAKLLFMGGERADPDEWDHRRALPPPTAGEPLAMGVRRLVTDLNALYRNEPALHAADDQAGSLVWLERGERLHSIYAYLRRAGLSIAVVLLNCTPVPRHGVRVGLPVGGPWHERLNTDSAAYGGSNVGNLGRVLAERDPAMGQAWSASICLPPLAALVLTPA
jgi:1,4-alpha-glucan branching enzyme